MWKSFSQKPTDSAFYIKVDKYDDVSTIKTEKTTASPMEEDHSRYRISVTNYVKLWTGVYDANGIINIMLESNEDVETEDRQGFLHAGLRMLHNPQIIDKKLFTELDNGNLCIKFLCVNQIVLKMRFTLKLSNAEDFFYGVTRPLLVIIDDQMQSEKKLRQLLLKKDEEIKGFLDMLPENSPLMRCLRTDEYNDKEHMSNHHALTELFGTSDQQGVCPQQILHGKPTPIQRMYPSEIDNNKSSPINSIKTEGTGSIFTSTGIKDSNTSYQISVIKSEPNNDISEPTHGTSGTSYAKHELKPNSDKIKSDNKELSESNSKTQPQTNKILSNLLPAVLDSLNQPMLVTTDMIEQSENLDAKPVDQDYNTQNHTENSPKAKPVLQSTTPKKRRKNVLNY